MNSDIRYLQQLEDDLTEAAQRDHERAAARASGNDEPPRRLPRRGKGRHWGQAAAAVMALLVLAASIGFLAQGGSSDDSGGSAGFDTADAGAPQATKAVPAPAPGFTSFDGGNDVGAADGDERAALTDGQADFESGTATDPGAESVDQVGQAPGEQQNLSKIVRDGRIEIVVANGEFDQNVTAVSRIAGNNGGIVLSSSTVDGRAGTFTLRIPAKRFDLTMDALRGLGTVKLDQITGEDVTAEFIDLQARLQILTDRRDLLLELQADATTSGEILRYAGLIDNVQFEIEKIQGNLNFLKDQVAEATIKVGLREQDAPENEEESPSDVDKPSLSQAFDYATQGFLRVLGAVVVGLGYLIPLGVLVLLGWLVFRLVRRRDHGAS
ncbi:MAG TPA: DUF4349 domain-containing protein [Actinomycetota bacterium]